MSLVDNPAQYDTKQPTNVRIEKALKKKLVKEATDRDCTLADIINEMLAKRYKEEDEVNEH